MSPRHRPLPGGGVRLSDTRLGVLVAVCTQRHPTVRSVAMYVGRDVETTYRHLERLREVGLVTWDGHKSGTLRPCVRIVPVPRQPS